MNWEAVGRGTCWMYCCTVSHGADRKVSLADSIAYFSKLINKIIDEINKLDVL